MIPTTKKAALNGFSSINVVTLSTIDGDDVGSVVVVGVVVVGVVVGDIGFTILTYDILFILLDDDDDDDDDKYLLSIISYYIQIYMNKR